MPVCVKRGILSHRGAMILSAAPAKSAQQGSTATVLAVGPVLLALRDHSHILSVLRAEKTVLAILGLKHSWSTASESAACVRQESSTLTKMQQMSQRQLGVASPAGIIWTQCQGPSRASAMPGTLDQSADHARQESTRMRRGKANVKPVPFILQLAPAPQSVSVMRASNLAAALALHVLQASTKASLQT